MQLEEIQLIRTIEETQTRLDRSEGFGSLRARDRERIERERITDKGGARIILDVEQSRIFESAVPPRPVQGGSERVSLGRNVSGKTQPERDRRADHESERGGGGERKALLLHPIAMRDLAPCRRWRGHGKNRLRHE